MARLLLPLAVFAAIAPYVRAGISFTSPKAGDKLVAGKAIDVEWTEGGTGPAITDLLTYTLFLIAGGNAGADQVSDWFQTMASCPWVV